MDLYDRVVEALDEYGILYGSVEVYDNGHTIHIFGVDESEWDDVVMAIEDLLGLEVEVPPEDHDELDNELIVRESLEENKKSITEGIEEDIAKKVSSKLEVSSEVALDIVQDIIDVYEHETEDNGKSKEEAIEHILSGAEKLDGIKALLVLEKDYEKNKEIVELVIKNFFNESLKEAEQDKELKWFVILGTKHSSSEVVEGFKTKEEALKALTKHLEEEPENIIFYTIRKEVPTKMFDYEW